WPGVVIVLLQWIVTYGSGLVAPGTFLQIFSLGLGPLVGLAALLAWWFFASRAPRSERWWVVGAFVAGLVLMFVLAHPTMPLALVSYAMPILCAAFILVTLLLRNAPSPVRRLALVAVVFVACGFWVLLRSEGLDGDMGAQLAWRWQKTTEEELLDAGLLAQVRDAEPRAAGLAAGGENLDPAAPWPGFRGPARDGVVHGTALATDWSASPPEELWRRPVGPGWGSFALAGGLLFTQEQQGEDEVVVAYRADSGEPVWLHQDVARFMEAMGGPGPRATPTYDQGRIYSLGATGLLNAFEAATGRLLWSRNLAEDSGSPVPEWGFSSSPLILDGRVIVVADGAAGKEIQAYDAENGAPSWSAAAGPFTYTSPHLAQLQGEPQVLVVTAGGITSVRPDGSPLWQHSWPLTRGARVVQPAFTADGDVLLGTGFGVGLQRFSVRREGASWETQERWTSQGLKPYYNDLVVHRDHVYGFDGRILACLSLADGSRAWKGGRYGNGQVLLLADQDLLLVLSDRGDVALVKAEPTGFEELATFPALEGKTWNHPVLADDVLYVRNSQEMAAFRLPTG
ncbi:MAG: PQQ-like beta-propeller repeat protein, partial [Acidobacteria bacterium]|nr:PQQ-like beta-propeller repeat protein [Acidobacteriota bacterium]